jgi:D123
MNVQPAKIVSAVLAYWCSKDDQVPPSCWSCLQDLCTRLALQLCGAKQGVLLFCADAMDVYVSSAFVVKLLDLNPWRWTAQPLLFTLQELDDLQPAPQDSRCTKKQRTSSEDAAHAAGDQVQPNIKYGTSDAACRGVAMRVVEDKMHIQQGAIVATGAPADLHMSLAGVGWNDVMAMLQHQALEKE